MENKNIQDIVSLEDSARANFLKALKPSEKKQVIENMVECAMRVGLMDAFDIKVWLGLPNSSMQTIRVARDKIKDKWIDLAGDIAESAATERVVQIQKVWEEIRKCEELYDEAKSVGDKVKVKQLQLQFLQYVAKLNFLDTVLEAPDASNQINIIAQSIKDGN